MTVGKDSSGISQLPNRHIAARIQIKKRNTGKQVLDSGAFIRFITHENISEQLKSKKGSHEETVIDKEVKSWRD
jgi:hypothetical protein